MDRLVKFDLVSFEWWSAYLKIDCVIFKGLQMQDSISVTGEEERENHEPNGLINSLPRTIWQELEIWARNFAPWQKFILSHAVHTGKLADAQVGQAYQLFLRDHNLGAAVDFQIPDEITG